MELLYKAIYSLIGMASASEVSRHYLLKKVNNKDDIILQSDQFPNTTILLPTLNEEWMMEKTLQSIKNQNIYKLYPDRFEILVVDSNSEDKTVEIAKNYADKIITMEERNLVLARTIGIENARGDMIIFIDADTIYPVNWLNSMLRHYYLDPQVVAVSGPEFHPEVHPLMDIYEPLYITLSAPFTASNNWLVRASNQMIGHNASCYKWAFNMVEGFDVPFDYNIKSSKDTQIVLEKYFAEKLKTIGKYVYDTQLIVYDLGGKRRFLYKNRGRLCNADKVSRDDTYLCNYWKEREKGIRF